MYEKWSYLTVFLVLLASGLGLPLPEDIPLLTGGYLCHTGEASLVPMILTGLFGVMAGDLVLFTMGRRFGHRIVQHRFLRRLANPPRLLMAEELFARHGVKIIFAGRFLPGLRPMIFMAAGILRVRPWVFIAVNGTAACVSVPLLVILGKFFGNSLEQIKRDIRIASHSMGLLLVLIVLVAGAIWLHRRQRRLIATAHSPKDIRPQELAQMPPHPGLGGADATGADGASAVSRDGHRASSAASSSHAEQQSGAKLPQ